MLSLTYVLQTGQTPVVLSNLINMCANLSPRQGCPPIFDLSVLL